MPVNQKHCINLLPKTPLRKINISYKKKEKLFQDKIFK